MQDARGHQFANDGAELEAVAAEANGEMQAGDRCCAEHWLEIGGAVVDSCVAPLRYSLLLAGEA